MAKTFIDFVPSLFQAPQYNITLDGNIYTALVTWNVYAQRYYITISALSGERIITQALVGSPIPIAISGISWNGGGRATVTTNVPHGLRFGQVADLTISGVTPNAFNGNVRVLVTGLNSFSYPLATNPGLATIMGVVENNIDLVAGLFDSSLVYREDNKQFEIA